MPFSVEPRITPRDSDYVAKVLEARRTPIGEKILAGPRLFRIRCDEARQLIRTEFPEFNGEQVEAELSRWLAKERQEDEAGSYRNLGEFDPDLSDEELNKLIANLPSSDGL